MKSTPKRDVPRIFAILFLIAFWTWSVQVYSQAPDIKSDVLRIKVTEQFAKSLTSARMRRTSQGLQTGIQRMDEVNRKFRVKDLRRVFPYAGKFETKHQRYGLHLWYEVDVEEGTSVLEAVKAFGQIKDITISEPVHETLIIGAGKENFGPVPVPAREIVSRAELPGPSDDPMLEKQWHYNNTGQTGGTSGADIRLFQAWGIETGRDEVIVSVHDGGVQADHPDLATNMWINSGEIPGNNIDDDNNGYVDDINGYGFANGTGTIIPGDHGTHVGGTVAAVTNNGIGVAGIAGGSGVEDGVKLMSCMVFDESGNGGFAQSYVYAADMGAVISQNSWGYRSAGVYDQAVLDAIDYFIAEAGRDEFGRQTGPMNGGIVIFAAGNNGQDQAHYPAYYEPTLSVASSNHEDQKAYYSNFGAWVDLTAPGGETPGAIEGGVLSTLTGGQYGYFQGTSMACPHVSGVAALTVSRFGGQGFTPESLKNRLLETADDITHTNPDYTEKLGAGRLNAFSALQEDDQISPNPIQDLTGAFITVTEVLLEWTAPLDSGNGSASFYDIRYADSPITESNFESATKVPNPPPANAPGVRNRATVTVPSGRAYYFAVKAMDLFGNTSGISNAVYLTSPADIVIGPEALESFLYTGTTGEQTLTLSNPGADTLEYTINAGFLESNNPEEETAYATGFERFELHNLTDQRQNSWWNFGNMYVDDRNPFRGNQHLRILDTENGSIYSPNLRSGQDSISSVTMMINLDSAAEATWSIIPRSESGVVTFLRINRGLQLEVYSKEEGLGKYVPVAYDFPSGYFELRVDVEQDSAKFTIYCNGDVVFSATAAASKEITRVSFNCNEGSNGAFIDVDEFAIWEGLPGAKPADWLESSRKGGELLPGESTDISFVSDAALLDPGRYHRAGVEVFTNVPGKEFITIPVSLLVWVSGDGISVVPEAVVERLEAGTTTNRTITLHNSEGSPVHYTVSVTKPEENPAALSYMTGMEKMEYGLIDEQEGWKSNWNWSVQRDNPYRGQNHLRGRGRSALGVAHSPMVVGATGTVSSLTMQLNLDSAAGTKWAITPRSETGAQYIHISKDLDISTWIYSEELSRYRFIPISEEIPDGYFELRIDIQTDSLITIYFNGEQVISGKGKIGEIKHFSLSSYPDGTEGTYMDIDDIYFWDGLAGWKPGLTVDSNGSVLASGASDDITLTLDATSLDPGLYTAAVTIDTNVPETDPLLVPVSLTVWGSGGGLAVSPDSIYEELEKGGSINRSVTIANVGTVPIDFSIATAHTGGTVATDATSTYTTGFEQMDAGNIANQEGWKDYYYRWEVMGENPYAGNHHLRCTSSSLANRSAYTPEVAAGADDISSVTMRINLDQAAGTRWQIIPKFKSESGSTAVTFIRIAEDRSISAYTTFGDRPITASIPAGYFELRIDVDAATSEFTVYFDQDSVFSGIGSAGEITNVQFFCFAGSDEAYMDIDDLTFWDGAPGGKSDTHWLTAGADSGSIPAGGTVTVDLTIDASGLQAGTYTDALLVSSSDSTNFQLPVTLVVSEMDAQTDDHNEEDGQKVETRVLLYPNPTRSIVHVRVERDYPDEISMTMVDTQGRVVFQGKIPAGEKRVKQVLLNDLERLRRGMYYLHLHSGEFNTTKTIIIE